MTTLHFVVIHENEQRLEAAVYDATGKARMISFRWHSKMPTPLPVSWWEGVCAEVELQRTLELEAKNGRSLV